MLMQGLGYNRYRRMDTEVRATTRVERGQEQARRPEQNKNEKEDRQRERAGTHFQFSPSGASCRRSLALLASFARFFFSFFWKKKKPARPVLLRRAFIEALAAWRRLVRFDGIGPWQRERRKEKEEERERKNSKACSCFFFAPVKKGGGRPCSFPFYLGAHRLHQAPRNRLTRVPMELGWRKRACVFATSCRKEAAKR